MAPKPLDQVKPCIRDKHHRLRIEEAYVYWIRYFIPYSGLRHPTDMGATEVKVLLSYLTNERYVSVSIHKQALCALLFLYKQAFDLDYSWLDAVDLPNRRLAFQPCLRNGRRPPSWRR